MATAKQSNRAEIDGLLDHLAEGFNFEWRGIEGKGLANELLDVVVEGILDRSIGDQRGPGTFAWQDNAEGYKRRPEKQGKPIGILTGQMLSHFQVQGTRTITKDEAEMSYGAGTGGIDGPTAEEKAEWFTSGTVGLAENADLQRSGATNQPPRPFYQLDDEIEQRVRERAALSVDEFIDDILRSL